jgi:hypothetical protein
VAPLVVVVVVVVVEVGGRVAAAVEVGEVVVTRVGGAAVGRSMRSRSASRRIRLVGADSASNARRSVRHRGEEDACEEDGDAAVTGWLGAAELEEDEGDDSPPEGAEVADAAEEERADADEEEMVRANAAEDAASAGRVL